MPPGRPRILAAPFVRQARGFWILLSRRSSRLPACIFQRRGALPTVLPVRVPIASISLDIACYLTLLGGSGAICAAGALYPTYRLAQLFCLAPILLEITKVNSCLLALRGCEAPRPSRIKTLAD